VFARMVTRRAGTTKAVTRSRPQTELPFGLIRQEGPLGRTAEVPAA
jgi:hypothetical protein